MVLLALMLIALIAWVKIPLAALGAASFLLITRRIKPQRVFINLDWAILVFFRACLSSHMQLKPADWESVYLRKHNHSSIRDWYHLL